LKSRRPGNAKPALGPERGPEPEPADQCQPTGKVPPTEVDIQRLIEEHNQAGEPLTTQRAISIVEHTDNTTATIAGVNVRGPDILYKNCDKVVDTVQVKAVKGFNGFNAAVSDELAKKPDAHEASRVLAFHVPAGTRGSISGWADIGATG
jgi:hypothetical protein